VLLAHDHVVEVDRNGLGELADPGELAAAQTPPLARWAPDDHRVIAISTELLSGRRIAAGLGAPSDADRQ
jgi:hypothetical protein